MGESQDGEHKRLHRDIGESRPVTTLLPIMAVVLIAFLIIGLALPVAPLHVHQGLGLGTFVVGLVAPVANWRPRLSRESGQVTTLTRGALTTR